MVRSPYSQSCRRFVPDPQVGLFDLHPALDMGNDRSRVPTVLCLSAVLPRPQGLQGEQVKQLSHLEKLCNQQGMRVVRASHCRLSCSDPVARKERNACHWFFAHHGFSLWVHASNDTGAELGIGLLHKRCLVSRHH